MEIPATKINLVSSGTTKLARISEESLMMKEAWVYRYHARALLESCRDACTIATRVNPMKYP